MVKLSAGLPVLVAGAGIGGLTVAAALARRGFPVQILERADAVRGASGSGLTIWTNGLDALDRIGLADRVIAAGMRLDRQQLWLAGGTRLNEVPVGEIGTEISRPGIGIRRRLLLRELQAGCAGIPIRYEAKVVEVGQDDTGVSVRLDDGDEVRGALLVGADGLRSRVRRAMLDDGDPHPEYHMIWRGISDSHANYPEHTSYMVFGRCGARSVSWPVGPDAVCWSVSRNGPPAGRADVPDGTKAALLEMLDGFPDPVTSIVSTTPDERIMRTDLFVRLRADRWVEGRVALLGDAAHAMPTTYGQGACQAIEDAVVLADALAGADSVETGLKDYERRRLGRVGWIRQRTLQLSRFQGWELPVMVTTRNGVVARIPPESQRQTWRTLLTFDDGTREPGHAR
ncbi:FAD-dependent oxidoreductase [Amycolatopsis azurea]|uniref:FAD-dependent oxidoreductase n=1 Tax=Amycolatopsis azurea DSM 43854 TaxID=1238180 RepID=M2P0U3_9PSEU|nr:FAD-dependent monooxygenase [Amycolatopsis azurea]EMD28654.1 FAD-dependent oxidoreductase [Amycolatopsis azurea DSM 43854]OOC08079.1 hypothetical protein B0293_04175 [Amycolatopsis azurea DSM 43854]